MSEGIQNQLAPTKKDRFRHSRLDINDIPVFDLHSDEEDCLNVVKSVFGLSKSLQSLLPFILFSL